TAMTAQTPAQGWRDEESMTIHTEPLGASSDTYTAHGGQRNEGTDLELDWVRDSRVNRSAVERRAATLTTRRSVKKQWQAAWLLKAISDIALSTLGGEGTAGRVRRLCANGVCPVRRDLLEELVVADLGINVGGVCVYHEMVP